MKTGRADFEQEEAEEAEGCRYGSFSGRGFSTGALAPGGSRSGSSTGCPCKSFNCLKKLIVGIFFDGIGHWRIVDESSLISTAIFDVEVNG